MTKEYLLLQLVGIENAKRENRIRVTEIVLKNNNLFPFLLEITFDVSNKVSVKAAWILELVCEKKISWLLPHLDYFTQNISKVTFDSAVRPISKICMFLAKAYSKRKEILFKNYLTKNYIDRIIETGFDWMISNQKVAAQAYTMTTLYLFGKNYDWVHHELKIILEQNITKQSAAYKARGKITLALINKK